MAVHVLIAVVLVACRGSAGAATYYVDAGAGNDDNDGLSPSRAWKTVGKVNGFEFSDGDTVLFKRGGVWDDATLTVDHLPNGFTIADYGTGNKPWFDGNANRPVQIVAGARRRDLVIRNIDISGQGWGASKTYNLHVGNIDNLLIDGVTGDGFRGWDGRTMPKDAIKIWGSNHGTVEIKNCHIQNYGPLDLPSQTLDKDMDGIIIQDATDSSTTIRIHDNIIHNVNADGIYTHYLTCETHIYDNEIYNCGEESIDLKYASNVQVYNNRFYRTSDFTGMGGDSNMVRSRFIVLHSDDASYHATNVVIRNNYFGNGDVAGVKARADYTHDIDIYGNTFENHVYALHLEERARDIRFYNNILVNASIDEGTTSAGANFIHDNTVYDGTIHLIYCKGTELRNNLVYTTDGAEYPLVVGAQGTSAIVSNNLWYNSASGKRVSWNGTNYDVEDHASWLSAGHAGEVFGDPLLTDPRNGDFRLQAGSPAVNAGADLGLTVDFAGNAVPQGAAPDIGALEYLAAGTTYLLNTVATHGSITKVPDRAAYDEGQTVTVQAIAADGYEFTGWSGDLSGNANPAVVTMDANKSITANFSEVAPTTYTLSVSGTHGTVAKTPNQSSYSAGATVTVQATADSGYEFAGWSGDLSGNTNPAVITMDANKSVTATFTAVAPTTCTLTVGGTNGSVAKDPQRDSYDQGETVQLTATPDAGYRFSGWSGDLSGSTNPVTITMNSNKSITGVFVRDVVDNAPPVAVASSPQADAVQVPRNSLVALQVSDEGEGVDADTVTISIDGATVYSGGGPHYESDAAICRRTGSKMSYTYTCQSETEFAFGETVTVRVNAADLNGNAMSEYVYSFKTEMWAFGGNRRVSWGPAGQEKGQPATASDRDGNLWVVWHAGPVGQRDIYASVWGPQDDRFAEPICLASDAADQANPDIAIGADDKLYVVWQDNRRGNWDIYLRTSSDGAGWSAETRITDSDGDQTAPAIAVDAASGCHVAWEDDAEGHADIYVAGSSDGFVSQTPVRVTSDTSDQTDPDIAVDASGNVYLVWTDARNGSADIYGAASNNGPWTNVALATGAGNQYAAALATEAAGAWLHLVWVHEAAAGSDVRYAATEGMPADPLVGIDLADDTSGADQLGPTVAVAGRVGNGLKVFVCWQDGRNTTENAQDTDLYFVEVKEAGDTNVLVGDGGTGSGQGEPAIGVDSRGFPYVVWTDDRDANAEIYHAAATSWDSEVLASQTVTASAGGTVGVASPSNVDDVSVVIPPAAASQDVTVTVTRIQNAPAVPCSGVLAYEFGPSGLQFSQPVTITIPYALAEFSEEQPTPWWYDSRTGGLSQEGITDIEHVALSPTIAAMCFKTTHFTPYYLISGSAMDEIAAGSSGGGCSLSYGDDPDPIGYFVPYLLIAFVMAELRIRDARRRARLR